MSARGPFAAQVIVTAGPSDLRVREIDRWDDAQTVLRDALTTGNQTVRLVGPAAPGLPRSLTISGGPDDPDANTPVHPNDIYRSAELRAGRYCVTVNYGDAETPTFRLRNVSLTIALEAARVFYSVGGVHEGFDWEEL